MSAKHTPKKTAPLSPPSYSRTLLGAAPFTLAASYYGWWRLIETGATTQLSSTPALVHTGSSVLDKIITGNVNFFKLGLSPTVPPFLGGYISSFATCAYIPIIEASRRIAKVSDPVFIGTAGQLLGRGVAFPIWFAVFVSSGAARAAPKDARGSDIDQYVAEGNLLSIIAGFIVPALVFTKTGTDRSILAWWLHPLTMAVTRKVYVALRTKYGGTIVLRSRKQSQDRAHLITLATYVIGFIYASSFHISVLGRALLAGRAVKLLGVNFSIPAEGAASLAQIVSDSIKWDAWPMFFASLFGTLGFARNKTEAIKLAVWDFIGTALFGTGGALNAVWIWREINLKKEREFFEN